MFVHNSITSQFIAVMVNEDKTNKLKMGVKSISKVNIHRYNHYRLHKKKKFEKKTIHQYIHIFQ